MLYEGLSRGWVAGYPPWYVNSLFSTEQATREKYLHLLRAIEDGNAAETRKLLEEGLDANAVVSEQDGTLLDLAVQKTKDPDCIRALLAAGARPASPRVLYYVIFRGREAVLDDVLEAGADPNLAMEEGESPLGVAAYLGEVEVMRRLIAAGANLNAGGPIHMGKKTAQRCTPLMLAAHAGHAAAVRLLLAGGADPNRTDSIGYTAMAWAKACRSKAKGAKVVELLEKAGAATGNRVAPTVGPPDFKTRARAATFQQALDLVKQVTGSAARSVELEEGILAGVKGFAVKSAQTVELLDRLRPELQKLNAIAVISNHLTGNGKSRLILFPTNDVYEAIAAFETPQGQSLSSEDLIEWLKKLSRRDPFEITHLAPDALRARFLGKLKDPLALANEIDAICHDVVNEPIEKVAERLEKARELYLWWD